MRQRLAAAGATVADLWPLPGAFGALIPRSAHAGEISPGHDVVGYLVAALLVVGPLLVYALARDSRQDLRAAGPMDRSGGPEDRRVAARDLERVKAECWLELGDGRLLDGEEALAEAAYRHALHEFELLDDPAGEGEALRRLAHVARVGGERERHRQLVEEACGRFRETGDRYATASALLDLGALARDLDDMESAGAAFAEAGELLRTVLRELLGEEDVGRPAR